MSSITYGGHDLSPYVSAELVEPAAHAVAAESFAVPGRPGALLLGGEVPPRVLRVRLLADVGVASRPIESMASARARLRSWLLEPAGATLVVPGEPTLEWHDAVCTGTSGWSDLLPAGSCEVEFTCFDPIAWGASATSAGDALEVGGTWRTWPTVAMVAEEADACSVTDDVSGSAIVVGGPLAAGDAVVVDCGAGTVTVNGEDASASLSLGSDLFALSPGTHSLRFTGCSSHAVSWRERWA